MKVYPEAKLAIGPAIKDGFYYDVDVDTTLSEESLVAIEKEQMKKIVKQGQVFEHEVWSSEQALYFGTKGKSTRLS